jgi:hypothetical protein
MNLNRFYEKLSDILTQEKNETTHHQTQQNFKDLFHDYMLHLMQHVLKCNHVGLYQSIG